MSLEPERIEILTGIQVALIYAMLVVTVASGLQYIIKAVRATT
jgi:hypothetical protein